MSFLAELNPVLVTGATGFVGANLVRELLRRGATVHVLLRHESPRWRLAGILEDLRPHYGDLLDEPFVHAAVAAIRPGLVYHLATHGAYEAQADARRIIDTNILGTLHLLEACERHGVQLLITTGSSSEYGFKSEPMGESDILEPASAYAVAKAAQTHLCQLAARRGKLATVVLRLFSVYGPWEAPERLIPTLIRRARANLPLEMVARAVARDFVYVDDVLEAMLDVSALRDLRGEILNVGTGVETNLEELVALTQEMLQTHAEARWGAMPARSWDTERWVADATKARQRLGWSARISLREGLGRMAAWMQREGDDYGPARTPSPG